MKISLGRPAKPDDLIVKRRISILQSYSTFFDKNLNLIDIGCGNGGTLLQIHPHFKSCHGIDVVKENILSLKKNIKSLNIKKCSATLLDIDQSTPNDKYDRAISFEVLEHVKNERESLKNIYNLLNENGLFAISVPNKWWIFETHGANLPLLPWNRVPFFSWLPYKFHSKFAKARIYTKKNICELLTKQGFKILTVKYITAPLDVIKWLWLKKILKKVLFRHNTTNIPILSTSILVVCRK